MEKENKYYRLLHWVTLNKYKLSFLMIASTLALILLAVNNLNNIEAEKDAAVSFEKMVEFLRSGQYFEAIEIAEKLQRDKENSEYANLSGLILAQLLVFNKQEAEAEDVLIRIVKSTSKLELNKIAAARLARLYISQEKFDKASEIAGSEFQDIDLFKEINADLQSHKRNMDLANQIYRKLIAQTEESGQSPEAFIFKKDNLYQQNNLK